MPPKTRSKKKSARDYRHDDKALLRPESGSQDVFPAAKRKPHKTYRFDSSLSPELAWDENAARDEGEKLLDKIINGKDLTAVRKAADKLKGISKPFLNWTGKAEREHIKVPTLPLFVHERLSTAAIIKTLKRQHRKRGETLDLFGEGGKSISEKIRGAYEHMNGWQNRLILGDSLQVMNSLLEYERMGGKVQMVYMDPPYGIKFGSNFQPFVRKQNVKDGDDDSISREPEMVQAYRDTWELGIHSWLTYMRDRLLLARKMLTDSGSCFVQISDENVHLVRNVMDEVFGAENFVSLISYRTTSGLGSKLVSSAGDYIVWYAKDKERIKYRQLFTQKPFGEGTAFTNIVKSSGEKRSMNDRELQGFIDAGDKPYSSADLVSSGLTSSCVYEFEFEGKKFAPGRSRSWKTNLDGMNALNSKQRLHAPGRTLRYVVYWNDFPVSSLTNFWTDTVGELSKSYVVQTSMKPIQRCMLMTTDPGDLVFDPTCGSGTTAMVAEQWGRRWITTDVSRVPLSLARQRLLTATFPYYKLQSEGRGPGGGFIYERKQNQRGEEVGGIVPHITLKSIANNEPPNEEVLVDKPAVDGDYARVSGPFCVEAVLPTPLSPEASDKSSIKEESAEEDYHYIGRMIRILQLSPVLQLPENKTFELKEIRPISKSMNLNAEAKSADGEQTIGVIFGPANGAISERNVIEAAKESHHKNYDRLLVIAFAIEPEARGAVQECEDTIGLSAIYAQASTDLVMGDLLKHMRTSQIFSVVGLPEVGLDVAKEKDTDGGKLWQVTLKGLDVFNPATMETDSQNGEDVPCWMLDPDYDGQCFRAGQVFFPRTSAWEKIRKAVKADFDEDVWDHLRGAVSAPFVAGEQVAVKVIDDRGNELMVVKGVGE